MLPRRMVFTATTKEGSGEHQPGIRLSRMRFVLIGMVLVLAGLLIAAGQTARQGRYRACRPRRRA